MFFFRPLGTVPRPIRHPLRQEERIPKEMIDLVSRAATFNSSVVMINSVEASLVPRYTIIDAISNAAAENNLAITRITLQSDSAPILVAGQAPSEDAIVAFKSSVAKCPTSVP